MKNLLKLVLSILILSNYLNAIENKKDYENFIDPKVKNQVSDILKGMKSLSKDKEAKVKQILDDISKGQGEEAQINTFFNSLNNTVDLLDKDNVISPLLQKEKNKYLARENNQSLTKGFTLFFFISENTSIDLIRNFSYAIEKLKEIDPTIDGLLLTRGLIGGNFDTMAKYVQNLQYEGIRQIEATFHPWAFEYFNLQKVPAYALSYCKKDFRFKTCKHKYLVRGELSLRNFFEIVSDEEPSYKKYYFKLIEAKTKDK